MKEKLRLDGKFARKGGLHRTVRFVENKGDSDYWTRKQSDLNRTML